MRERDRYRIFKRFSKFLDDEKIENRNRICVWDVVRGKVKVKNVLDMDIDPCTDLCEHNWPELTNKDCPCGVFGIKRAREKLDCYLSDYEAKHKKGGR